MALDPSIYDAFMFEDMKVLVENPLHEANRNTKAVNGILEASLANNLQTLQTMNIKEATAVSSIIRTDLSPQIAAMAMAISSLRDVVRTAQPATPAQ